MSSLNLNVSLILPPLISLLFLDSFKWWHCSFVWFVSDVQSLHYIDLSLALPDPGAGEDNLRHYQEWFVWAISVKFWDTLQKVSWKWAWAGCWVLVSVPGDDKVSRVQCACTPAPARGARPWPSGDHLMEQSLLLIGQGREWWPLIGQVSISQYCELCVLTKNWLQDGC